jgi:CRP-like cAMP-binding protein
MATVPSLPAPPRFEEMLASLDPIRRKEFEQRCHPVNAGAGEFVLRQDDLPDAVYIIADGVVEVVHLSPDGRQHRSLAYLSAGDIFGELGILTAHKRIASIRACEDVKLWKIVRDDFLTLMKKVPQFGLYISTHLAGRLYRATVDAAYHSYCTDFGGNLLHFDMLLIFQTIASSGEVGELRLLNPENDVIGCFLFRGNRVEAGRFGHLHGIEAVWQIFLEHHIDGTFAFQANSQPSVELDETCRVDMDGTDMLMQAAGKRDHFHALPSSWRQLEGSLGRHPDASLAWEDPESEPRAQIVWQLIAKRPQLLASLWRRLNLCKYHLADVAMKMADTGQAEWIAPATAPAPVAA